MNCRRGYANRVNDPFARVSDLRIILLHIFCYFLCLSLSYSYSACFANQ